MSNAITAYGCQCEKIEGDSQCPIHDEEPAENEKDRMRAFGVRVLLEFIWRSGSSPEGGDEKFARQFVDEVMNENK